jgi:hypothetical protein
VEVFQAECKRAGLDPKEVQKIARGLEKYARKADRLGLIVFGAGTASLRFTDDRDRHPLTVATMDGEWDGGDGAIHLDEEGLHRGE